MAAIAPKQQQENPKKESQKKEEGSGLVKSVPSGDTLILLLVDKAQGGPPPEKEITFSSLVAPRPAHFRGSKDDEHFAWQSREFLRKKAIGKVVHFTIEYSVEGEKRSHHYGTVKLGEEILNETMLLEGWCRVKPLGGKAIRPEQQHWLDLSAQAEAEHKGVFNKAEAEQSVRRFPNVTNAVLAQKVQGTTVQGVIDSVRDGTSVRVVFRVKDQWFEPLLSLAGAQSPTFKFDQASQEPKPEPFAREAKFFVERLLLHRDVQITVQGVDKQGNLYGTVLFNGRNICEELIKSGLARFVQWNAPAGSTEAWRELENTAKAQQLRIWKDAATAQKTPTTTSAGTAVGAQFSGKVREVLSAGVIVVQIGNERRPLPLSSITVPRMLTVKEKEAGKEDEPYAFEAKEFLRNKLIGKKVTCTLDYIRPRIEKKADKPELPEKPMYTVIIEKSNVAVQLVEEGLATVITHRKEDPCSPHYDLLLQAEVKAKQKNRGVHNKEPPSKVLDISKDVKGAKQRFPFFQRAGRQTAIIEYVFNPTRYRLYIPKERVFVNFALSALRSPDDATILNTATEWTRDKLHQREVEIEIENQDRGGTFLGSLYLKKKFFALTLVELGYAKVYEGGSGRIAHGGELQHAQEQAQKEKRGMWVGYDPELEKRKLQEEEDARIKQQNTKEIVNLSVTEVVDGSWFFANILGEEYNKLQELNQEIAAATHSSVDPASLKKGTLVICQFSGDENFYRARIESRASASEFKVAYIDFGNVETVPLSRIRKMDPRFATLPPQAKECFLAYIQTPQLSDDYGKEAAVFFREMVWGKTVVGNVEYREGSSLHLIVGDPDSQVHVNAALVHQGLARVDKKIKNTLVAKLREEEEKAKKSHLGIWRYGDDEDDDY